jgi:FkbM family methyltransferase
MDFLKDSMKLSNITSFFRTSRDDDKKRKDLLFDKLKPGDIFIDCGANTGQETIPALEKGAIVYAFEPHPEAFAALQKNVGKNNNAHLINRGVWDKQTKIKLYMHQNHDKNALTWSQGASLVSEKDNINPESYVEVEVVDLADFIESLKTPIKAIKIDVEGVEFDILEKLIATKAYKNVETILVETHSKKMKQLEAKEETIKKLIAQNNISNISLEWV